jgi:hypothetical protein
MDFTPCRLAINSEIITHQGLDFQLGMSTTVSPFSCNSSSFPTDPRDKSTNIFKEQSAHGQLPALPI